MRPDLIRNAMMSTEPFVMGASLTWEELFVLMDTYGSDKSGKDPAYVSVREQLMRGRPDEVTKGGYQSLAIALRQAIKECRMDGLPTMAEVLKGFSLHHRGYLHLKGLYDQSFFD